MFILWLALATLKKFKSLLYFLLYIQQMTFLNLQFKLKKEHLLLYFTSVSLWLLNIYIM